MLKSFISFLILFLFSASLVTGAAAQSGPGASSPNGDGPTANANAAERKRPAVEVPAEKARPQPVPKIIEGVVVDGRLDDGAWKNATVLKDFYQTSPGDNIAPSKPTEVLLMYDEKHLYIGFKCWDEKDKIRATVAKRDDVFGEDNVRVWLDTYNDQRRAYVLGFNPLGIQQDGIYTEGRGADFSVDIVMESKGVIEEWGWSVEVKIPFKSLRYSAGKGKLWGFNAARNIDRLNDEFDQWLPDDRNVSGFLIKHGKITGLDEIKYERTLEVVPSITLRETGRRFSAIENANGRFVNLPVEQDIGVSVKYTITPNITLDATYNPDFAEIEADAPVVTANQRFPIFFPEKRPFFLEGVEIFQTPLQVFYSRTIIDPDIAAKLTGKVGKTSFGFLAASDKAPGNFDVEELNDPAAFRRISEFVDKNAMFAVLRLKQDVGKEDHVGFFTTYRSFPEQHNLLGGFDGKFKLNPKTVLQFQVLGTASRRCFFEPTFDPNAEPVLAGRNREICGTGSINQTNSNTATYRNYRNGNGVAYFANYDYTTDTFGYIFEVGGRSRDYRADAGFTRRTDTNYAFAGWRLSTKSKPAAPIIRANWFTNVEISYDWQGRSQGSSIGSNLGLTLQNNLYVNFSGGIGYERIFEHEFGLARIASDPDRGAFEGGPERSAKQAWVSANINKRFNKQFMMYGFVGTIFNAFDFDFGGGPRFPRISLGALSGSGKLDPGPGQQYDLNIGGEWKPVDPLRISLDYTKARLVRDDTGLEAFDSNIASFKTTYQFTRFLFTRVRLDYDSISSNVKGQYLFGWNPNPGTAFYVGYNDDFNYNGFNPFTGYPEHRFERNSRTFFIRASYLFRKSF
jgi:hypothetical protein